MNVAPEIKGWCPGALRPMASGDGLLVRAKAVGSALPAAAAREIADIASACGNGLIDLSQRAQLQLRGVTERMLGEALTRLHALAMLAPDAATESVLNVLSSPLAGLDARASFDGNALARELADAIMGDAGLRALPGKFLFLIDDGSALGLADVEADIRLEARENGVAVIAAGAGDRAVVLARENAIDAALNIARAFVALREGRAFELRRMRLLVGALGIAALEREAKLEMRAVVAPGRAARQEASFGAQAADGVFYAGAGAPFGRWRADELAALAHLAAELGRRELRLTPWRALLVPAPSLDSARAICAAAKSRGLIVEASDPRLAVAACPGAPECPQALGPTRAHLDRLAPPARALAPDGVTLHVSGCAKGCARPGPTRVTLVTRGERYDLIENGRASDAPSGAALTLEETERALAAMAERETR
jgi:precorrin-3B synthase